MEEMRTTPEQTIQGSQTGNTVTKWVVVLVVIIVLVIVGWFFIRDREVSEEATDEQAQEGLGSELFEATQNPTENLPTTNPFEADTNPFEGYSNPFDR